MGSSKVWQPAPGLILALAGALALAGCGQRGDLYFPPPAKQTKAGSGAQSGPDQDRVTERGGKKGARAE